MSFRAASKAIFAKIGKELQTSLLHLFYPTKCLHCHTLLPPTSLVLCAACASLLELISLHERCMVCFNLLEENEWICTDCAHYPSSYVRMAAAFDHQGAAASLIKCLKYSRRPYLAQGMAAYLVAQLDQLQWPMPDALVPVPLSWMHELERGYNQSSLLAEEMGRLLQRPVWHVLKRQSLNLDQVDRNLEPQKRPEDKHFHIQLKKPLQGKTLLVIDDVMTSDLTLQRCAEALQEGKPAALYALTFARACS